MLTILNGFPSSWDWFVKGICARKKLPKFDKLWTDCTQEEARLISKMQKTNDEENIALVAHARKIKSVAAFHTPGSLGRNLQATRCVLGGKSRVKAVTLFLTPPFRLNS